jgi:hypothetical protein
MALIEQHFETLRAVLPEMLVNPEIRDQFYRQFAQPLAALLEQYVEAQVESSEIRPLNVQLTVRSVQAMFIGLLVLRILGDQKLRLKWDDLPEVLVDLLFEGLSVKAA